MAVFGLFKGLGSNTLFFPGSFSRYILMEDFDNYKEILNKLNVPFILIDEVGSSGIEAYNAGHKKVARALANEVYEILKKNSITKIITACDESFFMFNEFYPKWVRGFDIEIEHICETILKELNKRGITFKGNEFDREPIVYHDPCYLGRYSGIYDEPRLIIGKLGGSVQEMRGNHENSVCSGACGNVLENFPEIARKTALRRIEDSPNKNLKIITASSKEYASLRSVSEGITSFSEYVLKKLRGKKL